MRLIIYGAGGIGCVTGGHLARAGREVLLIGRPGQVEAINEQGLRLITPTGTHVLEIPAGGIDPGESPEAAVSRELQEEAGYVPRKVEKLGGFFSAPGYGTEYLYLYLASDLVPSPLQAEDTDNITLVRVPINDIAHIIASGRIRDAKSIAGLLTFWEYHRARQSG